MSRRPYFGSELADFELFADARRAQLVAASRLLTKVQVPAGQLLLHEGTTGDEFLIIADGLVSVTTEVDGAPKVLGLVTSGEVLGEMALLYRMPRSASATTLVPTTVLAATPREFFSLLDAVPSAAEWIRDAADQRARANAA